MSISNPPSIGPFLEKSFATISNQNEFTPNNSMVGEILSKIETTLLLADECDLTSSQCNIQNSIKSKWPEIFMHAEIELEKHWSRKVNNSSVLEKFPYIKVYRDIVLQEYELISSIRNSAFKRVFFLGSGPLPLTAIEMVKYIDTEIICVEMNPEFVEMSRSLIKRLSLSHQITIRHSRAEKIKFNKDDISICAIHLDSHDDLIKKFVECGNKYFIQREVSDLMECLYHPPLRYYEGFKRINSLRLRGLVNSSVLYKKK